jgi:hypothetical protein
LAESCPKLVIGNEVDAGWWENSVLGKDVERVYIAEAGE